MPRQLVLQLGLSPGDVVVLSAALRDLHRAQPGRYLTDVVTPCRELWQHNPYVTRLGAAGTEPVVMRYGHWLRQAQHQPDHFLHAFHLELERRLGHPVPLTDPRPDLHLSPEEKAERPRPDRYWVLFAGGKTDFTTKQWPYRRYQELVDLMAAAGLPVVQLGAVGHKQLQPELRGVDRQVGRTGLRRLLRWVYHADGVVCGITLGMHVAAAFERPCVVLGGGREAWWWEAYSRENTALLRHASGPLRVSHRYLHTLGLLPCCERAGCWKNKVQRSERDEHRSYCHHPAEETPGGQVVALCHKLIPTGRVLEAVLGYYLDGTLPMTDHLRLPAVDRPLALTLPDGRSARLAVELAGDPEAGATVPAVPLLQGSPPPPPPPPAPPAGTKAAKRAARPDPGLPAPAEVRRLSPAPAPPAARAPAVNTEPPASADPLDHPAVGGRLTCCVLFYGDYPDMHRRCLDLLLASHGSDRLELRVGANQVHRATHLLLEGLAASGRLRYYTPSPDNRRKYPVQRELYHDAGPLATRWTVWLDDDTMCTRPGWLYDLARKIIENPDAGCLGPLRVYTVSHQQLLWLRAAPWWRGRPLCDQHGRESPNGNRVRFAVGACLALRTEAIHRCQIPDTRLGHNGGDWVTGAQLWQHGYRVVDWTGRKEVVDWSSVPRRGLSERHPGR